MAGYSLSFLHSSALSTRNNISTHGFAAGVVKFASEIVHGFAPGERIIALGDIDITSGLALGSPKPKSFSFLHDFNVSVVIHF
jgi:hypothetical protein